jgi:hypothetical protein
MRFLVDRLTAVTWLELASRRPDTIEYLEATPAARALAGVGAAVAIKTVSLRFRMIDVRDEYGGLARFRVSYHDLNEAIEELRQQPEFLRARGDAGASHLELFLAKSAATSSRTDHNRLWRGLFFLRVCSALSRQDGAAAEVYIERSYCSNLLLRRAARAGLNARESASLDLIGAIRDALQAALGVGMTRFLLRMWRAHGLRAALTAPTVSASTRSAPMWAVEHWGQLNLDRPEFQSDQFFWLTSSLRTAPGLVVFRTPPDPLTRDRLESLRAHGIEGLAVDPASAATPDLPVFRPLRRPPAVRPSHLPGGELDAWVSNEANRYRALRAFWGELFDREKVSVFLTWFKNDATHIAVADAARDAGSVFALYQRSYESRPTWELCCAADVGFSFSPAQAMMQDAVGSRLRWRIATGFLGDHRFTALREPARRLREGLAVAGARRVVALFDENSKDDDRWHLGHERQRWNYAFLLEKVLSEPWLGLIVKPKVPRSLRRRLGPLAPILARAEATGRCRVLEDGDLQSVRPPAAAALAADLAVHGHLTAGTAGLEAALAGVPTALLDPDGFRESGLHRLGPAVVFDDWDGLWRAAVEHWQRPGGVPGFGDWSPLWPDLDPFRDGRAAERMGDYVA